jgi:hypothetical protein
MAVDDTGGRLSHTRFQSVGNTIAVLHNLGYYGTLPSSHFRGNSSRRLLLILPINRTTNLSIKLLLLNQTNLMYHRRHYTNADYKQGRQAAMFFRFCLSSGPLLSKAHLILMRAQ